MTAGELYAALNQKIPTSLSCDWDNDGLMCCPDPEKKAERVLVALDITAEVVTRAIEGGYDVIVSHHPLIFSPLRAVEPHDPVAKKVIRLLCAGVTAMSFHTRLDAVEGGVNDVLANALGLENVVPFGSDGEAIGRIGTLPQAMTVEAFAQHAKRVLGADQIVLADAGVAVQRVAVLGGGGSSDVAAAKCAGADTYLTGELKHNNLMDAPEIGMNLLAGGHFHTENLVCNRICELLHEIDATLKVDVTDSNTACVL
ncbi:MAG: Nif3-like dinuclear metal center hexameric protein [Clostridia bacterium]|nr:Nif3-like dinuclear metal center hexameric protein [Clostridia bacterium]